MKNLDIENLERKNIYKTPDGFFDDLQAKVLQETIPQKQARIVKLNWAYGVAAVIAMIFGIVFFNNQNNSDIQKVEKSSSAYVQNNVVNVSKSNDKPKNEEVIAYQTLQNDLSSSSVNRKANSTKNEQTKNSQKNDITAQNPEVQVDQVLSNFTSAELADLGSNAEQDVYLDLYN